MTTTSSLAFKQSRYLNSGSSAAGSGQYSKDTLFKNYNQVTPQYNQNLQNPQIQGHSGNQQNALSKSTLQTLEKLRNVRSLTPDKQQFMLNPQAAIQKAQNHTQYLNQTPQQQMVSSYLQQSSPQSNRSNKQSKPTSATHSKLGSKKYSISGALVGSNASQNLSSSRLNSSRVSNSKSVGPIAQHFQNTQQFQQQQIFNLTQPTNNNTGRLHHQNSNIEQQNINTNNSIDNLSTLRSSDVNEREKNLLEKIKHYKKENHQLIQLLKESEQMVSDKIQKQKRESEQILQILNKLWPLMQKIVQMDGKSIDQNTRNVLLTLGELLGRDVSTIKNSIGNPETGFLQSSSSNEVNLLKKENDFLKVELNKSKQEISRQRKQVQLTNIKCDLMLQEYCKLLEQTEKLQSTLQLKIQQQSSNDIVPSLNKVHLLECQLQESVSELSMNTQQLTMINLLEKIESFERDYLNRVETETTTMTTNILDLSPPNKKSENMLFDTEITLLNNNNYIIKGAQNQKQIIQPQIINSNIPTQRKGNITQSNIQYQQQPMGENTNVSLPDISSTEIAPNKLNAPSKIININHIRGLQFYQKQLGKNDNNQIEELGSSAIDTSGISNKINVKNNLAILRNRSTSPTIIPKKNLIKKEI